MRNIEKPAKKVDSGRPKKLIQSQVTSVDRLCVSKWRRDPIHERLLFLTGHAKHQIEDPEYVKHLDRILKVMILRRLCQILGHDTQKTIYKTRTLGQHSAYDNDTEGYGKHLDSTLKVIIL